jgi:hypothetical protein
VKLLPFKVQHDVTTMEYALIDRGANGGICGDDISVLEGSERFVDVSGLAAVTRFPNHVLLQHIH